MTLVQSLYMLLLKSSLWKSAVDPTLFEGVGPNEWQNILKLSTRQRTTAFIAHSIQSLPQTFLPSKSQQWKLILETEKIEEANRRLNGMIAFLSNEYLSIGIPFVLLKGQGVALSYPDPTKRTPGDIDLFFYKEQDYPKANEWVHQKGYEQEPESIKHLGFNIEGIHVENHRFMATFHRPKYNRIFLKECEKIVAGSEWVEENIDECNVRLLPHTFNACFLFIHLFHHFMHLGISMRQLCDWMLHLSVHKDHINKQEAARLLKLLALDRPASLFAGVAVNYLGAQPGIFPIEPLFHPVHTKKIVKDLLEGGHFGFYHPGKKRPQGQWAGRAHSYLTTVKRSLKMVRLAPEHIACLPYYKLINRIKITLFPKP